MNDVRAAIAAAVYTDEMRELRARDAAEVLRAARDYRWAGIYDVDDGEIEIVGHTGAQSQAFVRFSSDRGASGEAVRLRQTVVATHPDGSEMIVPILGAESGVPIGTLEVDSDRAFTDEDRVFVESCVPALMPLFE